MSPYPGEIEVWFVVSADAIIHNLEFFRGIDGKAGHVCNALAYSRDVSVLSFFQPGGLADAVLRGLQLSRLVVLHCGSSELKK